MLIEKEIVSPATYWYTDQDTGAPRKLVVTPKLSKYWHDQGNAMIASGLTVPIPKEHDFQAHPMTPAQKLDNNAGWIKEYRLKGDTLFGVCDIQDEEYAKKLPKTIRWTSPWINSFMDGNGKQWNNVISHLALTTRPRITKQAPFPSVAAALSMAEHVPVRPGNKGFCFSRAGQLKEQDGKLFPTYPIAFSLVGGIAMADDYGAPPKKKPMAPDLPDDDDDDFGDLDGDGDIDSADDDLAGEEAVPPLDMDNAAPDAGIMGEEKGGDVQIEEILADLLGALGITVDRTGGDFHKALYDAAMQEIHKLAGKGQEQQDMMQNQTTPPGGNEPNPIIQQEQQPMYMSLEEINKVADPVMKSIAMSMYQENVKLRGALDANAKTANSLRDAKLREENTKRNTRVQMLSRMSPRVKADLDAMLALPGMALSMGDGGNVNDPMAQTLAVLEKGLADMPRLLTTPAEQMVALAHPTDADTLTEERIDELANKLVRDPAKKAG